MDFIPGRRALEALRNTCPCSGCLDSRAETNYKQSLSNKIHESWSNKIHASGELSSRHTEENDMKTQREDRHLQTRESSQKK